MWWCSHGRGPGGLYLDVVTMRTRIPKLTYIYMKSETLPFDEDNQFDSNHHPQYEYTRVRQLNFARSMFRCSNLLYFGGNRLYDNVKVCAYCGSREDSETAIKVTHPTSRPTLVFAYDGPSMVAFGSSFW